MTQHSLDLRCLVYSQRHTAAVVLRKDVAVGKVLGSYLKMLPPAQTAAVFPGPHGIQKRKMRLSTKSPPASQHLVVQNWTADFLSFYFIFDTSIYVTNSCHFLLYIG